MAGARMMLTLLPESLKQLISHAVWWEHVLSYFMELADCVTYDSDLWSMGNFINNW
jgi:hypothetical protein